MYYVLYYTISGYYNCELCNCATCSHFALYVCMYLCQSRLGPGTYQVTSYASAARVSRGYMVCAHVAWLAHSRVAWLHGLRDGQRLPEGAAGRSWQDFVSEDTGRDRAFKYAVSRPRSTKRKLEIGTQDNEG